MAYLKLKRYDFSFFQMLMRLFCRFLEAENDASTAIELNDKFDKAYFRRGLARKELKRFKLAMSDIEIALKLNDKSAEIRKEYEDLKKFCSSLERMRISPINKPPEFQSTTPMVSVSIANKSMVVDDNFDKTLLDNLRKDILSRNPKNYHEFERVWREIGCLEDKISFVEKIDLATYQSIFKYPIEPKMLYDLLETLSHSQEIIHTFQIMKTLTTMPRFDISVCFLTKAEVQFIESIVGKFKNSNHLSVEDISFITKSYKVDL